MKALTILFAFITSLATAQLNGNFKSVRYVNVLDSTTVTPVNGTIYYNEQTDPTYLRPGPKFKVYENNVWYDLLGWVGSTVDFGTAGQIPFMNATNDNFSYNANLTWSTAAFLSTATNTTFNAGSNSLTMNGGNSDILMNAGGYSLTSSNITMDASSQLNLTSGTGDAATIMLSTTLTNLTHLVEIDINAPIFNATSVTSQLYTAPAINFDTPDITIVQAPTLNNASTEMLMRNSGTGIMEIRDVSTVITVPAGANTEIQYNNSGAFGAASNFTWFASGTSPALRIGQFDTDTNSAISIRGDEAGTDTFISIGTCVVDGVTQKNNILSQDKPLLINTTGTSQDIILAPTTTGPGYLIIRNIPTASAGLPSGAVWSNAGVLSIIP